MEYVTLIKFPIREINFSHTVVAKKKEKEKVKTVYTILLFLT